MQPKQHCDITWLPLTPSLSFAAQMNDFSLHSTHFPSLAPFLSRLDDGDVQLAASVVINNDVFISFTPVDIWSCF